MSREVQFLDGREESGTIRVGVSELAWFRKYAADLGVSHHEFFALMVAEFRRSVGDNIGLKRLGDLRHAEERIRRSEGNA